MRLRLTALFFVGLCPIIVHARYRVNSYYTNSHYLTLGGGAGYCMMFENILELSTQGNIGGTINFGYEFRPILNTKHGLYLNIGTELQYHSFGSTLNISSIDRLIYDTQGKTAMMHYDLDDAHYYQHTLYICLPITLGYYYKGFYLGGGAKVGYCVIARETASLRYTTSATYEQYIEDFSSMQDHFYTTYSSSSSSTTEYVCSKYKISALAEVGYDILTSQRDYDHTKHGGLKISFIAEYCLNNTIGSGKNLPIFSIDESNAAILQINPFSHTANVQSYNMHPFYVGLSLAWIFNIEISKCPWCNVVENHRNYKKRYNHIQH